MKDVQISHGIVPLGEFKAQASKLLKRLGESDEPMVITQAARAALMLPERLEQGAKCPRVWNRHGMLLSGRRGRMEHPNYAEWMEGGGSRKPSTKKRLNGISAANSA